MATATAEKKPDLTADGFASIEEAADFLAASRSTVYLLMNTGKLRWAKIGKSRRIPWKALRQFAQSCLNEVG